MSLMLLALLACGPPPDEPGPEALASRLQSTRADERDEATDALEALGLRALPAVRDAGARAEDPEARGRIAELIDRIGTRTLLRPTMVTLDVRDRPLDEVVASLRGGRGLSIGLEPRDDPRWRERLVTLDTEGPLGLWKAIDQLGVAGGVRLDPTPAPAPAPTPNPRGTAAPPPVPSSPGPRIRLGAGDWPPAPTAYAGPYRLVLLSLNRHRQVRQVPPPAEARVREDFSAAFQLVAEPGILVESNGPIRLIEATDDRGQDLRSLSPGGVDARPTTLRRWSEPALSLLTYRVPLAAPAEHGQMIARLRGYAPIIAVARRDEVLSFPLEEADGRSFQGGGVSLSVRNMVRRPWSNGSTRINALDVAIRGEPAPDPTPFAPGPQQLGLATLHPRFLPDDFLQVEDAQGRVYALYTIVLPARPDRASEFRITLLTSTTLGPPARLRYYGMAAVATEVPFDFADLPLP